MKKYFITSSGTGVGKTLVTAALTNMLYQNGAMVKSIKPIITGYEEGEQNDTEILLKAQGAKINQKNITACSPWRYADPISPNVAAKYEKLPIDFDQLKDYCQTYGEREDYVLIEGIGGVMVPLDGKHTIADLIARLRIPAILVVGSYLGSISHTLSAIAALEYKRVDDIRIVVSESENNPMPLEETVNTVAEMCNYPITVIPRVELPENSFYDSQELFEMI